MSDYPTIRLDRKFRFLPLMDSSPEKSFEGVLRHLLVHKGFLSACNGSCAARVEAVGVPEDFTGLISFETAEKFLKGRGETSIPLVPENLAPSYLRHPLSTPQGWTLWELEPEKPKKPCIGNYTYNPLIMALVAEALGKPDMLTIHIPPSRLSAAVILDPQNPKVKGIIMPIALD